MVTQFQRDNLITLASYLQTVEPPTFDMKGFFNPSPTLELTLNKKSKMWDYASAATEEVYRTCGTVACAAGHGPLAGIKPLKTETWLNYTKRVFGAHNGIYGSEEYLLWQWLFSMSWAFVDNTAKGAAARILWYIANGKVPDDYFKMRSGTEPLCYKVE